MRIYRISKENYRFLYHGTNSDFEGFELSKQVSGYYPGFYVTPYEDIAKSFGSNVLIFRSKPLNLYEVNSEEDSKRLKEEAKSSGFYVSQGSGYPESRYLESIGYDGIRRGKEIILFDYGKALELVES